MYLRNTFQSGQLVMPVPIGTLLKLRYGTKGILESAHVVSNDIVEISHTMFDILYQSNIVPVKIPITSGITEVIGVLYTPEMFEVDGDVPDAIIQPTCEKFVDTKGREFEFFAGHAISTASSMRGAAQITRWLKYAGFKILSHFLVPAPLTKDSFESACNRCYTLASDSTIAGFIIYDSNDSYKYVSTGLSIYKVLDMDTRTDEFGHVVIDCKTCNKVITVSYPIAYRKGVTKRGHILLQNNDTLAAFSTHKSDIRGDLSCQWCGRKLVVTSSDTLQCTDLHCMSNRYSDFKHFLHMYDLPELTFEDYKKYCNKYRLSKLSDIFSIEPWKSDRIETTLSKLLRAVIPVNQVSNSKIIDMFVSKCNGNINVFHHYIDNPNDVVTDFRLSDRYLAAFLHWLQDKHNIQELLELIDDSHIILQLSNKKFEGAPIFRGKVIYLTGKFKHGTLEDVAAILRSYSADITDKFEPTVDCIVIGSTLEDINSVAVKSAHDNNIPVFEESEFFARYEIDNDLHNNLVS